MLGIGLATAIAAAQSGDVDMAAKAGDTNVVIMALLLARELIGLIKSLIIKARIEQATGEVVRAEVDRVMAIVGSLVEQSHKTCEGIETANGIMSAFTGQLQVFIAELHEHVPHIAESVDRTDRVVGALARTWGEPPKVVRAEMVRAALVGGTGS